MFSKEITFFDILNRVHQYLLWVQPVLNDHFSYSTFFYFFCRASYQTHLDVHLNRAELLVRCPYDKICFRIPVKMAVHTIEID